MVPWPAFRVRLLETEGRHVSLGLRSFRTIQSAQKAGGADRPPIDLTVEGDRVTVPLRPYEWAEVEGRVCANRSCGHLSSRSERFAEDAELSALRRPVAGRPASRWSRICGQIAAHPNTTRIAPTPPPTIDGTTPNKPAVTPDSMPPSSLEATMKTLFTAVTRPRMSSGVSN